MQKIPTEELRQKRVNERRAVKELNDAGRRLVWLREKLGLIQREIAEATGIPCSSYNDRESGVRTDYYEEHIVLAGYFNTLWQAKYSKNGGVYPSYQGHMVAKITPMFLQYGTDDIEKDHNLVIQEFKRKISEIERKHYEREQELKRQIEMFPSKSA